MKRYIHIEEWMVQATPLRGNSLIVFALLCNLIEASDSECAEVSNEYIMERTGLSERVIQNIKRELHAGGWLVIETNCYRGQKTTYKKGAEISPLINEKRVQKLSKKGAEISPFDNTTINSSLIYKQNNKQNSSSTTRAREKIFAQVFEWITDNELSLGLLLYHNGLIKNPDSDLLSIVEPYIQEFVDGVLMEGGDFERKGRTDTKRHFSAWLRKRTTTNINTQNNETLEYKLQRLLQ